jgi:heme-degrading monooxygenase HmoA
MSGTRDTVLRVWRGAAQPADVPRYLTHFRARVEPALRALAGFRGAEVLTRPADALVEIVVQTRWASLDAVAAFAGADRDVAVVEPEALAVLAEHDAFVRHYAVAHVSAGGQDSPPRN